MEIHFDGRTLDAMVLDAILSTISALLEPFDMKPFE